MVQLCPHSQPQNVHRNKAEFVFALCCGVNLYWAHTPAFIHVVWNFCLFMHFSTTPNASRQLKVHDCATSWFPCSSSLKKENSHILGTYFPNTRESCLSNVERKISTYQRVWAGQFPSSWDSKNVPKMLSVLCIFWRHLCCWHCVRFPTVAHASGNQCFSVHRVKRDAIMKGRWAVHLEQNRLLSLYISA